MNTYVGRTGDPSHTRLDWFIPALHHSTLHITHFPKDQEGAHVRRGQAVLAVALRIWTKAKGTKWFPTWPNQTSIYSPSPLPLSLPPSLPPPASSPCLFAKWKGRELPSPSINLKRPDDRWHTSHSIFLLNWANQLISFGRSGMLRGWEKLLKCRAADMAHVFFLCHIFILHFLWPNMPVWQIKVHDGIRFRFRSGVGHYFAWRAPLGFRSWSTS